MANAIIQDLTVGSVPKKLVRFALPFMLSTLLQTAYGMVDMAVVGQFVGSKGLSAVSIASQLMWLTTALCMGFTNAGQIIISQYVGSGDRESISNTVGSMFTLILSASIVLSVVCCVLVRPILDLVNTPAEAWAQARAYSLTCFIGLFFIFGYRLVIKRLQR